MDEIKDLVLSDDTGNIIWSGRSMTSPSEFVYNGYIAPIEPIQNNWINYELKVYYRTKDKVYLKGKGIKVILDRI